MADKQNDATKNLDTGKEGQKITELKQDEKQTPKESSASEKETKKKDSDQNIAHKIIWHYRKYATLFHDQHNVPFIALDKNGAKILPIDSENFYGFISSVAFNDYNRSLSDNTIKKIILTLRGTALYGAYAKEYRLEVRHFKTDSNTLWYDLGENAVVIRPDGWRIVANPPILFKRFSHQERQVDPLSEGSIELLHKYVNIQDDKDWLIFQVFAITCFIPNFPKPLLVLNGAQGSGKSTPLRILKALIDPSKLKSLSVPKSVGELARVADHHSILFFDNLSKMPMDVSDNLCRLSTGDGFTKRKLYTDDDDVVYELQRPIMFNGINQIITQADLLDRSIPIELERIPTDKRKTEEEIWSSFYDDRPYILGAIFDILSKALKLYPTLKLKKLPRMADFTKWGYAIAESMDGYTGNDFLKAYITVLNRQNDEAIEASPVAQFIIWLMKNKKEIRGTATRFLELYESGDDGRNDKEEISKLSSSPVWPKDPSSFGRALNRVAVNLKNVGFEVEKITIKNHRVIQITRLPNCKYERDDQTHTLRFYDN